MGNQISCDFGCIFIEITIKFLEKPKQYENSQSFYSVEENATYYFLHYEKSKINDFKSHELYKKLEKIQIPVKVSGITYDEYFAQLPTIFDCEFILAPIENYTANTLEYFWEHAKQKIYSLEMINPPAADGSIQINERDFLKRPLEEASIYPYLLVNVKSGVSIYSVTSQSQQEKIGGSSFGFASIWALLKDHTEAADMFTEIIEGDSSKVDMTVGDIYGCSYLNLPANITASTCGKLKDNHEYLRKDLVKSLLFGLLYNVGQISTMHCFDLGITKVVIVGSVFANEYMERLMKFSFDYCSKGILKLIMCEHSQYLRSMGVMISKNS